MEAPRHTSLPDGIGYALYIVQRGGKHADKKALRGFGGAGILEIVEDHAGDTYRSCLHGSLGGSHMCVPEEIKKDGIKTPKPEIELIRSRFKRAEEEHARRLAAQKEGSVRNTGEIHLDPRKYEGHDNKI